MLFFWKNIVKFWKRKFKKRPPVDVARLPDGENSEKSAPVSLAPSGSSRPILPVTFNLGNLTSDDFDVWQAVTLSAAQAIAIKKDMASRQLTAFKAERDPLFNELSAPGDVVSIDGRPLKYTPLVIDRSLTRLCKEGALQRGEWEGLTRTYALLIPYGDFERPGL